MNELSSYDPPLLSPSEFAEVSELIYRTTGMSFGPEKIAYVSRRVRARMAETRCDFRRYATLLRCGSSMPEAQALIEKAERALEKTSGDNADDLVDAIEAVKDGLNAASSQLQSAMDALADLLYYLEV
jgi:hypothetical protein